MACGMGKNPPIWDALRQEYKNIVQYLNYIHTCCCSHRFTKAIREVFIQGLAMAWMKNLIDLNELPRKLGCKHLSTSKEIAYALIYEGK